MTPAAVPGSDPIARHPWRIPARSTWPVHLAPIAMPLNNARVARSVTRQSLSNEADKNDPEEDKAGLMKMAEAWDERAEEAERIPKSRNGSKRRRLPP
jgi:hypothetical protein